MDRRRGFTLIEILTVLAILGVLMAVVLPHTVNVRSYARQTPCMNNLHQIGLAFSMYMSDYGHRPVDVSDLAVAGYATPEILICPADPTGNQGGLACGDDRPECRNSSPPYPTSYIYLSGRRTGDLDFWSRLEALGSRGSYLACQCHGRRRGEWGGVGGSDRHIPWYEGKVLRLSFDGSVHIGRTEWAHGRDWQEVFSLWKTFTDEPCPPEFGGHPPL
jgi:prepilin-type N-terminal cleavage/methylation domain-containing protein